MNYGELKKKTLALIEELNTAKKSMTDDPDIEAKFPFVTNQVMFELARIKKISKYIEMEVHKGDLVTFADLEKKCGSAIYQINSVQGVWYMPKANGTVLKFIEDGTAEIDVFVFPESITEKTSDSHELELATDALEIMPYGIAGDLLKSDVSAEYGSIYSTRFETMLQRLDPRNSMTNIYIEGGVDI